MAAPTGLRRLHTLRGDVVFLDDTGGELRTGNAGYCPHNVFLAAVDDAVYLVHPRADGAFSEVAVTPGPPPQRVTLGEPGAALARPWTVMPPEGRGPALWREGHFLSTGADRRVTLSRREIGPAERFLLEPHQAGARRETPDVQQCAAAIYAAAQEYGREDGRGVLLDLHPDADTLVISCSGIIPNRVIYAMENTSRAMPTSKLFICDTRSLWYYTGIERLSTSFDATIELVAALVARVNPAVCCAIGTSAGGYMALALAARLGLDRALALAPQTNISAAWRAAQGDTRWSYHMGVIERHLAPGEPHDIVDLVRDRGEAGAGGTEFHVVYPATDELDTRHADRLRGFPNVSTYAVARSEHNVAQALHQRGELAPLLETFIQHRGAGLGERLAVMFEG